MRRVTAFLIVLLFTAVLAGCGGSSKPTATNTPPTTPPTSTPPPTTNPPPTTPPTASTDISGKVVDSATGQPVVDGTIFVALEELQQDFNYHTIAQQKADSGGNFDFRNVTATGSLLIVVTAINNRDLFDDMYVPFILAGADNQPGSTGPNIKPGTNVGTLSISYAPGPDAEEVDVAIESKNASGGAIPVTVNFTATTFQLDRHIDFPLPFAPEPATTVVNGNGCSAGTACGTGQVFVPSPAPTIQFFQGQQIQGNPASYAVFANAVVSGTQTPDCQPPTQEMDFNEIQPGTIAQASLVFNGCH